MSPEARRALALLAGSARTTKKRVRRASRTAVRNSDRFAVASATRPLPSFRRTGGQNPARVVRVNPNTGQQIRPPARRQASAVRFTAAGIPISGVRGIPAPTGGGGGRSPAADPQVTPPNVRVAGNPMIQADGGDGPIGSYLKNYFLPSAAGFLLGPAVAGTEAIRGVTEAGVGSALDYAIPDDVANNSFAGNILLGLNSRGREMRRGGIGRVQRIGTGIKDAYVHKYIDPIRRGDIGDLLARMGQDPFGTVGDAAAVWAGAGGLTRLGARGAARAGAGRPGGLIQRAADVSILSPTEARAAGRARQGSRYRPPREVTVPLNDEAVAGPVLRVSRDRRPMSRNPLTRELIQRPAMRAVDKSRARRAARADDIALDNPRARVFMDRGVPRLVERNTSAGQAERLVTRNARELRYDAEIDRDYWMAQNVDRAIRDIGNLDQPRTAGGLIAARTADRANRATPGTSPEQVAWRLHHEGLIPENLGGRTPAQIRELIVRNAEAANRGYEARAGRAGLRPRTRYTKEFIQAIREVPDHLIDLDAKVGSPRRTVGRDVSPAGQQARVRAAVQSTRELSAAETQALVDARVLTPEQASARSTLPSRVLLGGAQYGPNVAGRQAASARRAFAKARELEAEAKAAREAGNKTGARALRERANRWREAARGLKSRSRETIARTARDSDRARELRSRIAETDDPVKRRRLEAQLLREQRRNPGFTEPKRPELVTEGSYLRHVSADKRAGESRPPGAGGGLTQSDMKSSSGSLIRRANIDNDPRLVIQQAHHVANRTVGPQSARFVDRLVDQIAFKTDVVDPRVKEARKQAGDLYVQAKQLDEQAQSFVDAASESVSRSYYDELFEGMSPRQLIQMADDISAEATGLRKQARDLINEARMVERAGSQDGPAITALEHSVDSAWADVAEEVATSGFRSVESKRLAAKARKLEAQLMGEYRRSQKPRVVTAARNDLVRAADPDRVAFVNVGRLRNATRELDDLDPGQGIDVVADNVVAFGAKTDGGMTLRLPKDAKASDYVAVSKPALDEWVRLMKEPNKYLQKYDNLLTLWKGGLLAFSPRWYVNNFLGVGAQFMLLTTGDIRSIFQANRRLKGAVERSYKGVAENTLSMDVGMQPGVNYGTLKRAETAGFRFNNRMEGLFRRGAYFSRVKKILRDEGYKGLNKMSPEEWGNLLDNLPASVKKQAIREFELFLGDFRRFRRGEREVLKRIVPFYSWFRVITRLTFSMPFRNPLRWQALNLLRQAYNEVYAGEDKRRIPSDQGSVTFDGNNLLNTRYPNPFGTPYGFLESMGTGSVADVSNEAMGWLTPAIQAPLRYLFPEAGGNFLITTPGAGGDASFGIDPMVQNSVTTQFGPATPRRAITDAILETVFPPTRNIRTVLAGSRDPFADVRTFPIPQTPDELLRLVLGRGVPRSLVTGRNDPSIFQPDRERPSRPRHPAFGILGIPWRVENKDAREARLTKQAKRARDARKATNKKREKIGLPALSEYGDFWWER